MPATPQPDFAVLATLASPALSGVPTAPDAAVNTNTQQIANTKFVLGQAGTATPLQAGTAAVGTATKFAREDHRHPAVATGPNPAVQFIGWNRTSMSRRVRASAKSSWSAVAVLETISAVAVVALR